MKNIKTTCMLISGSVFTWEDKKTEEVKMGYKNLALLVDIEPEVELSGRVIHPFVEKGIAIPLEEFTRGEMCEIIIDTPDDEKGVYKLKSIKPIEGVVDNE